MHLPLRSKSKMVSKKATRIGLIKEIKLVMTLGREVALPVITIIFKRS